MCHIFFIYSSVDGHLGCFYVLAIVNRAAMKLEHSLTLYTKINSKWIEDLNVRPDAIKLLEESIGRTLHDINYSKILFDPPSRVMKIKTKINKWDLSKLKSFCTAKKTKTK